MFFEYEVSNFVMGVVVKCKVILFVSFCISDEFVVLLRGEGVCDFILGDGVMYCYLWSLMGSMLICLFPRQFT